MLPAWCLSIRGMVASPANPGTLTKGMATTTRSASAASATVPADAPSPSLSTGPVNVSGPRLLLRTTEIRANKARMATGRPTDPDPMIPTLAITMCLFPVRSQHARYLILYRSVNNCYVLSDQQVTCPLRRTAVCARHRAAQAAYGRGNSAIACSATATIARGGIPPLRSASAPRNSARTSSANSSGSASGSMSPSRWATRIASAMSR